MTSSFEAIRERAATRKGGTEVLQRLLGQWPDVQRLARLPDDRILSAMAERVFCAGFVWRVIEQKWPGFEAAFLGFEPRALIFQPDDFWHELTRDKRIVRNPQKIMSVRDNALFVDGVAREHGSFGAFLAAWPAEDQTGLTDHLAKHGSRLGGATGRYFLRFLGWDTYMVGGDVAQALREAGLDIADPPTTKRDLRRIQDQINTWADETGLSRQHISRILALSTGANNPPDASLEPEGA